MESYKKQIAAFEKKIQNLIRRWPDDVPESQAGHDKFMKEGFIDPLAGIIGVLRKAQKVQFPQIQELINLVDGIINRYVDFAYEKDGPYAEEAMPSFAHGEDTPLITDKHINTFMSGGAIDIMTPLLEIFGAQVPASRIRKLRKNVTPIPWKKTLRPQPHSSPCSRFRDDLPVWEATDSNCQATAVFEARCEIGSTDINNPCKMMMSPNGNVLALSSMGGWKDRTPYLHYSFLNTLNDFDNINNFPKQRSFILDLTDQIKEILLDDERKLIFTADWDRVKSYRWVEPGLKGKPLAVHTMRTENYDGPLALLPGGRFLRAGKKGVAVWNLDSLPTHGEKGKDIIGKRIKDIETWRDDPENIEASSGSDFSTTITFADVPEGADGFVVEVWHQHPSQSGVMLCGTKPESHTYYCHAVDLEAGGKTVTKYLGHGGSVEGFSTSTRDPNVFVTACKDGVVRLYDVRQALPVLSIKAVGNTELLSESVLADPDGIPFIFTGGSMSESIRVWDVRSRAIIYDLAIGNNSVESMAWDASTNSLYAATSCPYIDRMGRHIDYRAAKIPIVRPENEDGGQNNNSGGINNQEDANNNEDDEGDWEDVDDDDDDDDEDEDEDEDEGDQVFEPISEDRCWPKRAYHNEDYYGHVFDCGDHRLFRYTFKSDPDIGPDALPYYGSAGISRGGGGFGGSFW